MDYSSICAVDLRARRIGGLHAGDTVWPEGGKYSRDTSNVGNSEF